MVNTFKYCVVRTLVKVFYIVVAPPYPIIRDLNIKHEIVNTEHDIIRWGDGETTLLLGGKTYFQSATWRVWLLAMRFIWKARSNSNLTILVPTIETMKMKPGFKSTLEVISLLAYFGWAKFFSDALAFRDNPEDRASLINYVMANIDDISLICSNKFQNKETEIKCIFGNMNCVYVSSSNPAKFDLQLLLQRSTAVVSGGPIIKWEITTNQIFRVIDFGHGLDRVLEDENISII